MVTFTEEILNGKFFFCAVLNADATLGTHSIAQANVLSSATAIKMSNTSFFSPYFASSTAF